MIFALLPAAGSGTRMGSGAEKTSKLFLPLLDNKTVIECTLEAVLNSGVCDGVVIAARPGDETEVARLGRAVLGGLGCEVVTGGETRQESVFLALEAVSSRATFVLVHDAARPLCSPGEIRTVTERGVKAGAAILALPVKSTLKKSVDNEFIDSTVSREGMWEAQTPQVFSFDLLYRAYLKAQCDGFSATDDSQLVERLGEKVSLVLGSESNIKITTARDLDLARSLLSLSRRG